MFRNNIIRLYGAVLSQKWHKIQVLSKSNFKTFQNWLLFSVKFFNAGS